MRWRALAGVVALAAFGWSAWWFVGSAGRDHALEAWLRERRDDGWQAEAASIRTRGFPNRFDTRIESLLLADPRVGWVWETPFLDIMGLSYQPHHFVVAPAPEQTFGAPGETVSLTAGKLIASVRFVPGVALELARLSIEGADLALAARSGWTAGADRLEAHLQESDPATAPEHAYEVHVVAEAVSLPPVLEALVDPLAMLESVFDSLVIDARVALTAPIDRHAVEQGPPRLDAVSLAGFDARWGELRLRAKGLLEADPEGYAEGRLDLRAENWRDMLRALVAAKALDKGVADAIEAGLGFIAGFAGDGDKLEVPLTFSGGYTRLGPVPLGPAPKLR